MRPRRALHSSLRIALVLLVGLALLPVPCVSMLVSAMGQGQSHNHRPPNVPPRPGKPASFASGTSRSCLLLMMSVAVA